MFFIIILVVNVDFLLNFFKINCYIGIDVIEEILLKKERKKLS